MRKFAWQLNSHTGCPGHRRRSSRLELLALLLLAIAFGAYCAHLWH